MQFDQNEDFAMPGIFIRFINESNNQLIRAHMRTYVAFIYEYIF